MMTKLYSIDDDHHLFGVIKGPIRAHSCTLPDDSSSECGHGEALVVKVQVKRPISA
jgi:hypothetical protein